MPLGPNFADRVLGATVLGSIPTVPNTVYLALYSSIGSLGNATEEVPLTGGLGYARQVVVFGSPSNRGVQNTNAPTFAAANTPWGSVTRYGVCDASSGGNLIYYDDISTISVITSMIVQTSIGSLTIKMDN